LPYVFENNRGQTPRWSGTFGNRSQSRGGGGRHFCKKKHVGAGATGNPEGWFKLQGNLEKCRGRFPIRGTAKRRAVIKKNADNKTL